MNRHAPPFVKQSVGREHPKIDRIACPWLVTRVFDPSPEFPYVPAGEVMAAAQRSRAIPFDVPDAELGHHGALCRFDALYAWCDGEAYTPRTLG